MNNHSYPWITRQASREIFQKISTRPEGVHIYFVQAPAGVGKTFIARDIGTRLGSESGYEPGHKDDIYWSGIVDLYDPDTSNSKRIEQRWMQAFSSLTGFEFRDYRTQRDFYESKAEEVALPSELEKQVESIRNAFAQGMELVAKTCYPVIAFDTVERLETVLDPAQQIQEIQAIDPPDVFDWLSYQIERLPRGTILMMGRAVPKLIKELEDKLSQKINPQRKAKGLEPVEVETLPLKYLTLEEQDEFFRHRLIEHPRLTNLLDQELKSRLISHAGGNPLLLDIAIQTLLETQRPDEVRAALQPDREPPAQKSKKGRTARGKATAEDLMGMKAVEAALLTAYMHFGTPIRQSLLIMLAIARNGLFEELLKHLDPEYFSLLKNELERMQELPFIKVRNISVLTPGQEQRVTRKTYFFHDEMYAICDRVKYIGLEQICQVSKQIVSWYDAQIKQHREYSGRTEEGRRPEVITDLLVESLPYRMRSDPKQAYQWYLKQSDRAIRAGERGLDSRLRDAMAQFISSAAEPGQTGEVPTSAIDRQILISQAPEIYKDFRIDSALLWIKRYSVRGRHEKALEIAQNEIWVNERYATDPERYLITLAELRLWQGQSAMYAGKPGESLRIYNAILAEIEKIYSPDQIRTKLEGNHISQYETDRICHLAGRMYNNRGYINWMYMGKYWLALEEFAKALKYFDLVNLPEETANTKDNIGRVYSILGYSFPALEAIREGLKLRTSSNLDYREALSRTSLAIAYTQFDNVGLALQEVENALQIFRHIRIERGVALAQLTRGLTYRTQSELWRELNLTVDQALQLTEKAENDLLDALGIFIDAVQEPIRNVQAYNEVACCYRSRYLLLKQKHDIEEQRNALRRGLSYFERAIAEADLHDFLAEKLDSLQDRAVLHVRVGQFDKAKEDLQAVRKLIPSNHKIQPEKGLPQLAKTDLVDAYYKLMGQVELLTGAIVVEEGRSNEERPDQNVILDMIEHYVLAVVYFNTFSGKSFTNRHTNSRIYARLRKCDPEFLMELRDKHLAGFVTKYNLPANAVQDQFYEVFELLIPGSKGQKRG
jgi:tetratricopeptide (TPR) repeat protein